jgi:hypothetical protein
MASTPRNAVFTSVKCLARLTDWRMGSSALVTPTAAPAAMRVTTTTIVTARRGFGKEPGA